MSDLHRRDFLKTAAVALATAAVPACRQGPPLEAPAPAPFEFAELTIAAAQARMQSGEVTSRGLVEAYLARIEALDRRGPALNAILELNPDARTIAGDLDRERKDGRVRGPLHGVPIVIKGNIDTHDRMSTTAGSLALKGVVSSRDAGVVERVRAAGAVIIAKSNLSEWANFRSMHSSSGWSALGGQGKNPYALNRTPCGSSSGSAQATAANLTLVSIGTETDGSIVCPSSSQALVGIKPTVGRVSAAGIVPIAHSQDTAGPLARTVADAAILLGVLDGTNYAAALDANGLRGARIGVVRAKVTGYHDDTDRLFADALAALKAGGAALTDPADIPHLGEYDDSELEVLLYEFKADLNTYLAAAGGEVRSLAGLIEFNNAHRGEEMPHFGQELFIRAQEKGPLTERKYLDALARNQRLSRRDGIDAVMQTHRLDALVAPTAGPPWVIDQVNGDHFTGGSSTAAAVSGYPSITVPMGFSAGLPVGLSFIGRAASEATLIRVAYAFEQATKHRKPPDFRLTA